MFLLSGMGPNWGQGANTYCIELRHDHIVLFDESPEAGWLQFDSGLCRGVLGDGGCSEPEQAEGEACQEPHGDGGVGSMNTEAIDSK